MNESSDGVGGSADYGFTEPPFQDESAGISQFNQWFNTLRRYIVFIIVVTLTGAVLSFLYAKNITPLFTAKAEILIDSNESSLVDFEAVLSGISGDHAAIASQVQILRSRSLIARLVDRLSLTEDPEFNPHRRETATSLFDLLALLPEAWLDAFRLTPDLQVELSSDERERRDLAVTTDIILARLTVEPVRSTYVLTVSVTSSDPKKAALIANTLSELYILDQLEAKFQATQQANDWLSTRLQDLRQEVVDAEAAVAAFRVEANLGEDGSQSLIEQQLTQANAQLTIARSELAAAEANYYQIQNLLNSEGVTSAAQVLDNILIQQLRQQEAEANRNLAELSTRYGEKHPEIINAQAEIADLQATIENEVSKIVQNLINEVAVAQARENSIAQTISELNERFNVERGDSVRARELEREADATRLLYDTMLARYKEVSEQEEIQQPDARILSMADMPRKASSPKTQIIVAAAGLLSFLIGVAITVLLEHLNSGFRSLEQQTQLTGLPGLVEVPLINGRNARKSISDYLIANPTSSYAEAVRTIQTALLLSNVDRPPEIVAFVSSVPEEGKSALSISTAQVIASGSRSTLLVDCDLRRPQQHKALGLQRGPGLSDLLAGTHDLDSILVTDERTGLNIITAGADVPNPHDLIQSKRMQTLLADLRERFDIVVLDTPALLAVADGLVLANLADTALVVVRWEKTPRQVVLTALRTLRLAGANIAGVVLSQVNQKKQSRYGYSGRGYYYGNYRNYYNKT